jgi:hypothetical protein
MPGSPSLIARFRPICVTSSFTSADRQAIAAFGGTSAEKAAIAAFYSKAGTGSLEEEASNAAHPTLLRDVATGEYCHDTVEIGCLYCPQDQTDQPSLTRKRRDGGSFFFRRITCSTK